MPKTPASDPQLKHFAGLWTLHNYPPGKKPWTIEQKIKSAREAGFDAMGGGLNVKESDAAHAAGLEYIAYINGNADYRKSLAAARATDPVRVNVQLLDHDTKPVQALPLWLKIEQEAEKLGLAVDLEVHRDTCTETPEKTYELADLYKKATGRKIRLCFDFSHIAVVKHLNPPYAERLLERPDLVRLSRQAHFRPFNGHHCQVPATDGKGRETPELQDYLAFLDAFLACWLEGAKGGEVLYACPEFGPLGSGYGLPAFADVWKDAILVRAKTEALWKKNLAQWKKR